MVFKLVLWLHVTLYRLTGGRLGGRNIILLTTTGKKSGQSRTRPLFHMKDRGDYIVIASAGGSAKNPAWYANLTANPRVTVEDHGRTFSGVARTLMAAGSCHKLRVRRLRAAYQPGHPDCTHSNTLTNAINKAQASSAHAWLR
jgi:deazaflavin-dependent oxidoreductase (nitroreductase family)